MNKFGYISRPCPSCNETSTTNAVIQSKKNAENFDFDSLIPHWNGFFKEKIIFSYTRCAHCGLLYAPIFFSMEQLNKLYSQMPPNMDVVPLSALQKTQKKYFSHLATSSKLTNGYIEIGPDIGIFTSYCVSNGDFNKYWLFEPNRAVEKQLTDIMKNKDFSIINNMVGFEQVPNQTASVAVMIQVLDHLLDPVKTLKELRHKLTPDGKLLLVTHNEQSLLSKVCGWKWPAFCLQHPQIYNPSSIKKLLYQAGYQVDSCVRSKNHFELEFLVKHLLWIFGIDIKKFPTIFKKTIGLKLGNIITLASKI